MILQLQSLESWEYLLPIDKEIDVNIGGYDLPAAFGFLSLIVAVSIAPLWEETLFRGIIPWITKKITDNKWIIFVVPSILFGAAHMYSGTENSWIQVIYASLIGMYFMGLRLGGKSLGLVILLHFLINYTAAINPVETIEDSVFNMVDFITTIVVTGLMAVNGILYMNKKLKK